MTLADCDRIKAAKAALRVILDPASFPSGYKLHQRLIAVTFANPSCFVKAYAKTAWSWPDDILSGKKAEYLYTDEKAYGSPYDSPMWQAAMKKKEEESQKQAEVDAFFDSIEKDSGAASTDVVQPPPSINLSLCAPDLKPFIGLMRFISTMSDHISPSVMPMADLPKVSPERSLYRKDSSLTEQFWYRQEEGSLRADHLEKGSSLELVETPYTTSASG